MAAAAARVFAVLFAVSLVLNGAYGAGKTLVLLDNMAIKETHSMFFRSLSGQNLPGLLVKSGS